MCVLCCKYLLFTGTALLDLVNGGFCLKLRYFKVRFAFFFQTFQLRGDGVWYGVVGFIVY